MIYLFMLNCERLLKIGMTLNKDFRVRNYNKRNNKEFVCLKMHKKFLWKWNSKTLLLTNKIKFLIQLR